MIISIKKGYIVKKEYLYVVCDPQTFCMSKTSQLNLLVLTHGSECSCASSNAAITINPTE